MKKHLAPPLFRRGPRYNGANNNSKSLERRRKSNPTKSITPANKRGEIQTETVQRRKPQICVFSALGKSRTTFAWREGASVSLAESRKVLLKPRSTQTSGGGREERKGKEGEAAKFPPSSSSS